MNILEFQIESQSSKLPKHEQFQYWVDTVLTDNSQDSEIVIRIVDEQEMTQFNEQYRHKIGPTNILSFPSDLPEDIDSPLLGDLLICAPVMEQESFQQGKKLEHHWAHIIFHGILHLLGYNHIEQNEAEEMESLEVKLLNTINIANPYEEQHNI